MSKSDLRKRFREYIDRENLLSGVQSLIVGVSGGADSICLFNLLSDISEEYAITLFPVHVNHGIRGEEADRDAAFTEEAVAGRGFVCTVCHVDVPAFAAEQGLSEEEAARILRYRELERVCSEKNADAIALAHHRGDQAETVLMNLFRGSGPSGLVGMEPRRGNRIRPLLFASKNEILSYLQEKNIIYVEDSTNFELDHTRNRIRSELLPLAESLFSQAEEHVAFTAADMAVWRDQIRTDAAADPPLTAFASGVTIDRKRYLQGTCAVRTEWLRLAVDAVIPGKKDVSRRHYQALDRMLTGGKPGLHLDLPGGCHAKSTYDGIVLCIPGVEEMQKCNDFSHYSMELIDRSVFNQKKNMIFQEKDYTKCIDYDRIENGLLLRHPAEGDYFILDETGSRKKLSRFYIDRKVPRELRPLQEVLADGSHIVWAVPDRISEAYKVTDETRRVLVITRSEVN